MIEAFRTTDFDKERISRFYDELVSEGYSVALEWRKKTGGVTDSMESAAGAVIKCGGKVCFRQQGTDGRLKWAPSVPIPKEVMIRLLREHIGVEKPSFVVSGILATIFLLIGLFIGVPQIAKVAGSEFAFVYGGSLIVALGAVFALSRSDSGFLLFLAILAGLPSAGPLSVLLVFVLIASRSARTYSLAHREQPAS